MTTIKRAGKHSSLHDFRGMHIGLGQSQAGTQCLATVSGFISAANCEMYLVCLDKPRSEE